jgi:Tol biopolymer transport system component
MRISSIVVGLCVALSPAFAAEHVAYMQETADGGKHIVLIDGRFPGAAPRAITSGSDWHLYPALSSDGQRVAYVQGPSADRLAVVVHDLVTGNVTQVTAGRGMHLHPTFSGDGRKLAFSTPLGVGDQNGIGIMTREASGRFGSLRVISSSASLYFPALSSDGSVLVYQESVSRTNKRLFKIDFLLDNPTPVAITPDTSPAMAPSLSVDDRWVAYTSHRGGNWDVYVQDLRTGDEHRLTDDAAEDYAPSFTSSGEVLFASNRSGRFQLYRLTPPAQGWGQGAPTTVLFQEGDGDLYAPTSSGEIGYRTGERAAIPGEARSSFGAIEHLGKLYVVGGHQGQEHTYPPESFVSRLDSYDLATGTWTSLAPRPVAAQGFQLIAFGRYLYALGGFAYNEDAVPHWRSLDEIDRYDTVLNRWETVGHMPRKRSSHVAVAVGARVYLFGGWDSTPSAPNDAEGTFHREVDVFDLVTETVSVAPYEMPDPLRRAFTGLERGGKIYLIGGLGQGASHFELLDAVTEFDPATGSWTERARLPFATFAPAAGFLGDELFVFGGMFKTGTWDYRYVSHVYGTRQRTDGTFEPWRHTGRYLREAKGFSMVLPIESGDRLAVLGGHAYFVGGVDSPVDTFETFGR